MLLLRPTNTGLTFNEWQDAIHDVPDQSVIGSPFHDPLLNLVDKEYLQLELWYRHAVGQNDHICYNGQIKPYHYLLCSLCRKEWTGTIPETILPKGLINKRGIGNWRNPKVVIVLEKITSHLRGPSPLWNEIPRYRRLRPMSGVRLDRAKLVALLQAATGTGSAEYNHFQPRDTKELLNCYITTFDKAWLWKTTDPIAAFIDELNVFPTTIPVVAIVKNETMSTLWKIIRQEKLYHIPSSHTWDHTKKKLRSICLGL